MFTFLEGQGVDDVICSADPLTPEVDDTTADTKQQDNAISNENDTGEISSPEPLAVPASDDVSANGFVTSSPMNKSSEDVADLEFRGDTVVYSAQKHIHHEP